jgi:hypothetical protein
MDNLRSGRRTDEHLIVMLADTAIWAVHGRDSQVLCLSPSLHRAIGRASGFTSSRVAVVAISRLPSHDIIVDSAQIERLRKFIAGREVLPIRE